MSSRQLHLHRMLLAAFAGAIMPLHLFSFIAIIFQTILLHPKLNLLLPFDCVLTIDPTYMHRCLQLATLGEGYVAPNPMVGAVLVYNDQIIGEGYHTYFGGPHAEVECINSV
ncbi:MAG TPA: hypothetical protein VEX63_12525, partial [Flavisolibacter sp.]|nr:hypothetical protein [Flavisolibacter sp.]